MRKVDHRILSCISADKWSSWLGAVFFPYAILFFALCNILNVAFILSAIGANLVWPITLYSSSTFAESRSATVASPRLLLRLSMVCLTMQYARSLGYIRP